MYKHTCPNGFVYVGITSRPPVQRWKNGFGYESNRDFFRTIVKYGWDNIKHEVLYTSLTEKEARKIEKRLIEKYERCCYNTKNTKEYNKAANKLLRKAHPRVYWEVDGIRKPAREWCNDYDINYSTVIQRMSVNGLTVKQALTFPKVPLSKGRNALKYWRSCGLL